MNKFGIFSGFWTKEWAFDVPALMRKVKGLGFDILEWPADIAASLSTQQRAAIKGLSKDLDLELTFSLALAPEIDISSEDAAIRRTGIDYLIDRVKVVNELGQKGIGGVSYGEWRIPFAKGRNREAYRDRSVACLKEVAKVAEDLDVHFVIEAVNRFEQFIVNTAAQGVEMVDMINSPNVKLLLDTFHMNIEEDQFVDAILLASDRLGHFHTNENSRKLPGTQHLPWGEIFEALQKINYKGAIVTESFVQANTEVGDDVRLLIDTKYGDMDLAAKKSLELMKSFFKS